MLRKTPSWWLVLLMYRGKFLRRNNLHLLSSVCLCGLFHGGVIYCSTVSSSLISHSSDWDVIFFFSPSDVWAGGNESVVPSHGCLGGNGTSLLPIAMSLFKNANRGRALVKRLMITRLCRTFLLFFFFFNAKFAHYFTVLSLCLSDIHTDIFRKEYYCLCPSVFANSVIMLNFEVQ